MFTAPLPTNAGLALYYAALDTEQFKVTKIQMGDGHISGPVGSMTALVSPVVTIEAAVTKRTETYLEVSGHFSNADLEKSFSWREIGVFAANPDDPDNRDADILAVYQNAYDSAEEIPVASTETVEKTLVVPFIVSAEAIIQCLLPKSLIYISVQDLEDHNNDPDAHGDLRTMIQGNTDAVAMIGEAAKKAQATANGARAEAATAKQAAATALDTANTAKQAAATALDTANTAKRDAATAVADARKAQVAADAALEAITKLAHTIDATPSQNGALVYTGGALSPSWNSYNPETMTMGGTTTATNAGTYAATFTPKEGYTWSDGTTTARPVTWTIGRAAITATPSQSGSLTYTGGTLSPSWSNYNSAQLTIGGTKTGTNAEAYSATFTPTANYQWSDGTTTARPVTWTIGRAAITATPSQSGSLTYTGGTLSPSWSNYNSAQLTIGGTTTATNAGTYAATFTPTANYKWSDGSTSAKSANWTVGKAAGSLSLNKTSMTLNKAAMSGVIAVTRAGDGAITAASSSPSVATVSVSGTNVTVTGKAYGSVAITVKVAEGTNHTAPGSKTCAVQVNVFNTTMNSNTWAAIKAASDAGEGANNWSVGATKAIRINGKVGNTTFSNLAIDVFIIGFNHNSGKEGTKRIHFQIGKIGGKLVGLVDGSYGNAVSASGAFAMNTSNTNSGGWSNSHMRKTVLGSDATPASPRANTLLAALPSDLRAVMKSVTKYSDNTGGGQDTASYVTATTDYLFLLAEHEYHGARTYANSAERTYQTQYDYYKAGNSKVHYKHSAANTAAYAWCRSVNAGSTDGFCLVYANGSATGNGAGYSWALAPGFCV